MKDRIREVRKCLNLTQAEFGEKLGVQRPVVTSWEIGKVEPSEMVIKAICREFGVYEDWLVHGVGEMYGNPDNEIMAKVDAMMTGDNEMVKAIVRVMSQLTQDEWKTVEKLLLLLAKERGG